jgi:hypothetical protein
LSQRGTKMGHCKLLIYIEYGEFSGYLCGWDTFIVDLGFGIADLKGDLCQWPDREGGLIRHRM